MRMLIRFIWRVFCVALVCAFAVGLLGWPAAAGDRNPCLEAGNLTQNCGFDAFVDDWVGEKRFQIPVAWWYFILAGDPDYRPADDTYWGAPSLWLLTDGEPFTAGIYQQVAVTPGVVYQTDIGWAAVSQPDFERKLGLDPTGGTDPLAPSVIWGRSEWTTTRWPDLTVSARATGPTMTVFVWVHHPRAYGQDWVFLDAVGLWPDPNQPAATVTPMPSLTPTSRPPTRTPVPAQPTPTATASATSTPTATPTDTTTATPSTTPTATPTATPTPTLRPPTKTPYPTRTSLPTLVPVAEMVPANEDVDDDMNSGSGPPALLIVVGAVAVAASAGSAGSWWLRRNWGAKE